LERNALLEIVRISFKDDHSTTFDVNKIVFPSWMDFEPSCFPTIPAPPARMFLLLEAEMYRYYGSSRMAHSCLQQLLRQDLGIWAASALRTNNYRLVAVPTQSDPTECQTLASNQMRTPLPILPDNQYVLWPRLNILFVPTKFRRWITLMDAKRKRGYFQVLHGNTVKDVVRVDPRVGIQNAALRNPISRALLGELDWECKLVTAYIRNLFNAANNDSKSFEAFIALLLRPSVEVAVQTSWLSIVTDHIRQKDKSTSFLSVGILNGNTTCLPDDVILQFREFFKVLHIP
jgi:hypothetical protein